MKTATGACKFCGQIMTIEVPENSSRQTLTKR